MTHQWTSCSKSPISNDLTIPVVYKSNFHFPVFSEFKLQCWGSWDEDDFKFILLSHGNNSAQYVMVSHIFTF